jgi:hypothetical protein
MTVSVAAAAAGIPQNWQFRIRETAPAVRIIIQSDGRPAAAKAA